MSANLVPHCLKNIAYGAPVCLFACLLFDSASHVSPADLELATWMIVNTELHPQPGSPVTSAPSGLLQLYCLSAEVEAASVVTPRMPWAVSSPGLHLFPQDTSCCSHQLGLLVPNPSSQPAAGADIHADPARPAPLRVPSTPADSRTSTQDVPSRTLCR